VPDSLTPASRPLSRRNALKTMGGAVALSASASAMSPPVGAAPVAPTGSAQVEARARALLARMTVAEKLGQLQQLIGSDPAAAIAARAGMLGEVLDIDSAKDINALQRIAVEHTRLGIPILFGLDVIHGFITTFPIPLAQGSSFDPATALADATVGAREARASGITWTFAPMVDVTHEPRWGRIAEGYGEDPFLAVQFAVAKVRGYQGEDYAASDKVVACAKHFAAYGGAEGGRDYNTVDVSEQRLRNLYLPTFRACVQAGVATVMASFNTISGVPAHANHHTLTDVLKGEWGFDGFVTSDYTGIQELIAHGIAADGADAARLALNAGVDVEMVSTNIVTYGRQLLAQGKITMRRLDDAVLRVLRIKLRAGLFEHPFVDESREVTAPAPADRTAARTVAARSMVLLRNENGLLPLSRTVASIAVVGPLGNDTLNLHGTATTGKGNAIPAVSILEGIKAAAPGASVSFTPGCGITDLNTSGIPAAVAAAVAASVTVIVVGESQDLSGEASSRSDIRLPGVQEQLISAIAGTGKPLAVVLLNGRPLAIDAWLTSVPALLEAWHPGIEGGNAVADVLFGAVNPGGKLPVTFPRTVGQVPIYYNHENTGRPPDPNNKYTSKYLDLPIGPLLPFGFGLSYTTFEVSGLTMSTTTMPVRSIRTGTQLRVSATVKNTGTRAGDEVVQLYIHDVAATIVQPVRRLRGFQRVSLPPGRSASVAFSLGADDLGFWTNDGAGQFVIEPGLFEISVATNAEDPGVSSSFTLTG
jgi:beta-glucosidase